jgi:hypothetical protein
MKWISDGPASSKLAEFENDRSQQNSPGLANGRTAQWALSLATAVLFCLAPWVLWRDGLQHPFMKLDDFVYLAQCRTWPSLFDHLMTPHNAHVVPLFAIQNHLLARLAGSLEAVSMVWSLACYVELVLAMLATGALVAFETGRVGLGLAAMAGVGMSTVVGPAVLWYSAGQAICSGTMILVMLCALALWRSRRDWLVLVVAVFAAVAAPLYWSAGYVAGPVGLIYLLVDRRVSRGVVLIPLAASLLTGLLVWSLAGSRIAQSVPTEETPLRVLSRIPIGLAYTAQAIPEVLVLSNLGLNAPTTLAQGAALCVLLAMVWAVTRQPIPWPPPEQTGSEAPRLRGPWLPPPPRLNALEAAGAALVVTSFTMIYSARGHMSFDNLRALGWYHAIPQLGAVLFATGWVAGRSPRPARPAVEAASLREIFWVALFAGAFLILQTPRASRVLYEYDGMASKIEIDTESRDSAPRNSNDLARRSTRQRTALARLDRLEKIAQDEKIGRDTLRQALGRRLISGMPSNLPDLDAFDLLDISAQGQGGSLRSIQAFGREFEAQGDP